ncbi:MAG: hypothetical protein KGJ92_04545 [Actinomycetales bacterium]|nr:hypothetical protein [Actinomycetales bacterium]
MATKFHRPVARAASLAAALALTIPLAPLAASAAKSPVALAVRGTVVDTNAARHTLVISNGSAMDTVRFANPRVVATVALGTVVTVRASRLADGTFRALSLRAQGHANHTTIHGTVVSATAKTLVLSTGASTIAVNHGSAVSTVAKTGRKSHDSSSLPGVGTDVSVGVTIGQSGLDETSVTDLGQSGFIGLEGTLASVSTGTGGVGGTLVINVEDGATTTVTIPTSITIPSTIKASDTVELLTSYAGGVFTLVTITDDSIAATQTTSGVSTDQNNAGYLEAEGLVTSITPTTGSPITSFTLQPGDGAAAMTFVVDTTTAVMGTLQVGSRVHVMATESSTSGTTTTTTLTAVSVRVQQPEGEGYGWMTTEAEGQVQSYVAVSGATNGSLTILSGDSATPMAFVVTPTTDVQGTPTPTALVHVRATVSGTTLTAVSIRVQQPEGDQGNQNNQGGQSDLTHIDGSFVSYTAVAGSTGTLSITPNGATSPVMIVVPTTYTTPITFTAGTQITVTVTSVASVLTLVTIAPND